jgi:hypothetical protein
MMMIPTSSSIQPSCCRTLKVLYSRNKIGKEYAFQFYTGYRRTGDIK